MYEPHQILGAILFGAIGLYLAVFFGSLLVAWVYGSFLHDGDKEVWSLPALAMDECEARVSDIMFLFGLFYPVLAFTASAALVKITMHTGMLIPYILMGVVSTWAILYVLRAVIRLNKKLDKHESDKNAHK